MRKMARLLSFLAHALRMLAWRGGKRLPVLLLLPFLFVAIMPLKIEKISAESCSTETYTNSAGQTYCMPGEIHGHEDAEQRWRDVVASGEVTADDITLLTRYAQDDSHPLFKDYFGYLYEALKTGTESRIEKGIFACLLGGTADGFHCKEQFSKQRKNEGHIHGGSGRYFTQAKPGSNEFTSGPTSDRPSVIQNHTINSVRYNFTNNYFTYNTTYQSTTYNYNITYDYRTTNIYNIATGESYSYYRLLPDGSSSYNMTEEQLKGIRTNFTVSNYDTVYDYPSVLGLYHMDGDMKDSSYYSGSKSSITFNPVSLDFRNTESNFGGHYAFQHGNTSAVSVIRFSSSEATSVDMRVFLPTLDAGLWIFAYSDDQLKAKKTSDTWCDHPSAGNVDGFYVSGVRNDSSFPGKQGIAKYGSPSSWNHLRFVKDGSNVNFYVNGTFVQKGNVPLDQLNLVFMGKSFFYLFDEVRFLSGDQPEGNFIPPSQPYDTNRAYILPASAEDYKILVKSDIPVSKWQIGGKRSSAPERGDFYIYVDDSSRMRSSQQFDGVNWIDVPAAIYSQSLGRWVSYEGFSLLINDWNVTDIDDIPVSDINTNKDFFAWLKFQFDRVVKAIEKTAGGVTNFFEAPKKTIWDFLITLIESIRDGIAGVFGGVRELLIGIKDAVLGIFGGLKGLLKLLFVPRDNSGFMNTIRSISTKLNTKFGLKISFFDVTSFFDRLSQSDASAVFDFAGFEYMGVMLIPAFHFDFAEIVRSPGFSTAYSAYRTIISVYALYLLYRLFERKMRGVLRK